MAESRLTVSGGPRFGREFGPDPQGAGPATTLRYRPPTVGRAPFRVRLNTREVLDTIMLRAGATLEAVLDAGKAYWEDVEWTKERHPEMTGAMRDGARFRVERTRTGVVAQVWIPPGEAPHADFEERGTIHRAGHFPLRQTTQVMARELDKQIATHFPGAKRG